MQSNTLEVVQIRNLFDVTYGTNLEMVRMTKCTNGINFVSRTSKNNGVADRVSLVDGIAPTPGGVLSVAGGGSVLETFVQLEPFYSGRDLFILTPLEPMSVEELLFYATCIKANQPRYSYGRQANRTLRTLTVPSRESVPQWVSGAIPGLAQRMQTSVQAWANSTG